MNITIDKENMTAFIYPSNDLEKNANLMENPEDNYRYPIQVDDSGHLYVDMPNYKEHETNLFTTRIGDAFDYIKSGEVDTIFITHGFSALSDSISAYYYIDREYGEMVRKDTIEKIKNIELEYAIVGYNTCSFAPPVFIGKKGEEDLPYYAFDRKEIIRFSTETEANKFIDRVMNNVKILRNLMDEYRDMRKTKSYNDPDCVSLMNKIKLYGPIAIDLARNKHRAPKDGKFVLEIRQVIKE